MISDKRIAWALTAMLVVGLLSSVAGAETVGLWTFNEKAVGQAGNDGDTVLDTGGSANTHNGTIKTDVGDDMPYVAGSPTDGPALRFERGTGVLTDPAIFDRVEVPGHADFTYTKTDSYTMEVMFASNQIINKTDGTGPLVAGMGNFWMDDDTEGKIMFSAGFGAKRDTQGDTRAKVWSTTTVNDGGWHHVAAVFDGTAQVSRVYVDGVLEGTEDWSAWASNDTYGGTRGPDAGETLYFGTNGLNYSFRELDADIDFVRISNEALTPEDFNYTPPIPIPGDANVDGLVNAADAAILASHWLQMGGAGWEDGDFNGDGNVTDVDATLLATNWQATVSSAAGVPEPSGCVFLLSAAVFLFVFVHRRRQ